MPLVTANSRDPLSDGRQSERALEIRSGVIRGMARSGLVFLAELTLKTGRRADLVGIDQKGQITIVEIKSSIADFRVDTKWPEYTEFCDRFYFATHMDVPMEIFPEAEGFIVADKHGCEIIRESREFKLAGARRKAITLQFARASAGRLERLAAHAAAPGEPMSDDILNPD